MRIISIFLRLKNVMQTFYLNKILVNYNRIVLRSLGCRIGENVKIPTICNISADRGGLLIIGDNVTITGHSSTNPLNHHKPIIKVYSGGHLEIGSRCGLSSPTIWCSEKIVLEEGVGLGGNVTIMDTDAHSLDWQHRSNPEVDRANCKSKGITIGEFSLIGMNTIILKGVNIGARSVIGAGSVVIKDIPADCIAAGNPCKVIKYINRVK